MAVDLYNNPFDNLAQRNYVPQTSQNRLQIAYNQAMQNKSPNWTYTVADMMPSIAEIIAAGTTKKSFNQGRIADSLEREKERRIAYDQMMRENENKMANDYVQMAKDQLAMDMAEDEKEYNRQIKELDRNEQLEARKQAYEQASKEDERKDKEIALREKLANLQEQKLQEELNALKYANSPEGQKAKAEADDLERRKKIAEVEKLERENNPDNIAKKEAKEQYEKDLGEVNKLIEKKMFNASDSAFLLRHPEAYREAQSRMIFSPFRGKYEIPQDIIDKYEKKKGDTYGIFSFDDVNTGTGTFKR